MDLIKLGAFCEDATASTQQLARYANHFYDPAHGGMGYLSGAFPSSLVWGLETTDIGTQDYSSKDAWNYFYNGLTLLDTEERKRNLAAAFRAIGQVIHLVQDMAQPQHTRNDSHGSGSLFEGFTERVRNDLPFTGYAPSKFASLASFWHTADGRGLADYSNAGFVSGGTNFAGTAVSIRPNPNYPKPDGAGAMVTAVPISDLRSEAGCRGTEIPSGLTGAVLFVGTPVADNYTGTTTWNPRTSTFSIFDEDLKRYANLDGVFTLNRFNFCETHKLLVPRAVAYSAGLINYFFRGELEISLPDEGVYGVIDHNVAANSNAQTGGFPKLKLKLRNVTPAGTDGSGQPLVEPIPGGGGTLVAVVKFHRNLCYQPDLSGEYGSPGIDWRACRSPTEEIVVSQPVAVPAGINSAAQPVTFTFASRIPISATDLYLQVVYRGPLGEESDAVVVATRDIAEPRYIYNYARWDQYTYAHYPSVDSGPYSWAQWCAQGSYASLDDCNRQEGQTGKAQYSPNAGPIPGYDPANPIVPPLTWTSVSQEPPFAPVMTMPSPVGTLTRVAVLTEANPTNMALWVVEWGASPTGNSIFMWNTGIAAATRNQLDPATGTLVPSETYLPGRGVYLPTAENSLLTDGTASNIPALVLAPSQISF